ncbi:4Fe-4S dicluster domain-containing protein [Magnetofaba australis]|uniref:Putative ferredoxin n=1 Tax=Magnetofaba australis IT-1 TaxID=1434232 RepID=A0A1Y2KAB6_9PROT|nr:4Fe-4S dicluster domain-containing protein [Magnetofaba australis]OSM08465.1 putative ferredoxin [Magnetofaba australis IT-1]
MNVSSTEDRIVIYYEEAPYEVPAGRTIIAALEEAGIRFVRGVGCRGGVCGACAAFYRIPGDKELKAVLMCQQEVVPDMRVMPLTTFPQNVVDYDLTLDADETPAFKVVNLYPEVNHCIMCRECTRLCPVGIDVMGYVGMIKRGDLKAAAEESFTCVQCQACASRCPAQISQPNAALAARRYYAKHIQAKSDDLVRAVERAHSNEMRKGFQSLRRLDADELRTLYQRREKEPADTPPGVWLPEDRSMIP